MPEMVFSFDTSHALVRRITDSLRAGGPIVVVTMAAGTDDLLAEAGLRHAEPLTPMPAEPRQTQFP